MKRIVFPLINFGRQGGHRVIARLADVLIDKGCEVIFVVRDSIGEQYYPSKAKVIPIQQGSSRFRLVNSIINNLKIINQCRKLKPDVLVATMNVTAYMVFLSSYKCRKVYYVQADESIFATNFLQKLIANVSYRLPLDKIVNNESVLKNSKAKRLIGCVPAGVDFNVFKKREKVIEKKVIGFIGRKEKYKGNDLVIDALIRCSEKYSFTVNIALYLSEENKEKLNRNKVNVNVIPIKNDIELSEFYRSCDLIIACGLVENGAFHYPCAESMASFVPVISNYAPLAKTESEYYVDSDVSSLLIESKIDKYFSNSMSSIKKEQKSNYEYASNYSWSVIGELFYNYIFQVKNNG